MSRFNLLDEPWITVIVSGKGDTKDVSLKQVFANAHTYYGLAGETKTQDFAVLRLLLAVSHTVFSRFDYGGNPHDFIELDERYKPLSEIDEDEADDYTNALYDTWTALWQNGEFPTIIDEYLEKWRDRFYLFDDQYPFYQVTKKEVTSSKISKSKPSEVLGKNINRLISESNNKVALFSPKYEADDNKEKLTAPEVIRWLITYQGYVGLADKVIFGSEKYKSSKGWIFDLGGLYLSGDNLFETLLLNMALVHPDEKYVANQQKPCWEFTPNQLVQLALSTNQVDNLAQLYTNWSRGIQIDTNIDLTKPFSFNIVKLPDINHTNQFLELMTLWRFNLSGESKDAYTPRKHRVNQSLWRSYGLLTISYQGLAKKGEKLPQHKPGIIEWLTKIKSTIGDYRLTVQAISMQDDGNATSWVPIDEIYDSLNLSDVLLIDLIENGWVPRINDVVENTKTIVGFTFKNLLKDISEIRNLSSGGAYVNQNVESMFYHIDHYFKMWIAQIEPTDSKEDKVFEWYEQLRKLIISYVNDLIKSASSRDYLGKMVEHSSSSGEYKNIAISYNQFMYRLNRQLPIKEVKNSEKTQ